MNTLYRHWKLFRRIAISIAILLLLTTALTAVFSNVGWIFASFLLFACAFCFAFTYLWPFLARGIAEINHRLFNSMNPKSIWIQVSLLWFSMIGILLHCLALALPSENAAIERVLEFAIGLCGSLGLFVGSGNFIVAEHNQAEQGGGGNRPSSASTNSLPHSS